MTPEELLTTAPRCVLAFGNGAGPFLAPMAFWSDGGGLWMSTSAATLKVRSLGRRAACAVYVPPLREGGLGLVVRGPARVFGLGDPTGLLLHGPTISAAMTALAVKNAPTLWGYAQDAARIPPRWLPRNRVVLRVAIDETQPVRPPAVGPGIAPALPSVVPPDVRRVLAGMRRVVVAGDVEGRLVLAPAVWGGGFALAVPPGFRLPEGRVAVTVDVDPVHRPTSAVGLTLRGHLDSRGRLDGRRVTWWRGFDMQTLDVPVPHVGAVMLPD